MYKSFPIFTYPTTAPTGANGLFTGDINSGVLMALNVAAPTSGDVTLNKLTFAINSNNASISNLALIGPYGLVGSNNLMNSSNGVSNGNASFFFDSPTNTTDKTIAAGTSKTYYLKGIITTTGTNGGGSVSTALKGDVGISVMQSVSAINSQTNLSSNIIWSPDSNFTPSATSDTDWTNGYALPGCFATAGLGQDCAPVYLTSSGGGSTTATTTPTTAESVTPSSASISSGDKVTLNFVSPSNSISSAMYLYCPKGVMSVATTNTSNKDYCNRWIKQTVVPTSVDFQLYNSTSQSQNVVPNYYVYLPNNPNYAVGVSSNITVAPGVPIKTGNPTRPCSIGTLNRGLQMNEQDNRYPCATKTTPSITHNLVIGSKDSTTGGDVSKLQQLLINLGYYNLPVSGIFGKNTLDAVKRFQKDEGFRTPTGLVGSATRNIVKNISNQNYPATSPYPYSTNSPNNAPSYSPSYSGYPTYTPSYTNTATYSPTPTYSTTPQYSNSPTPYYSNSPSPSVSSSYSPSPSSYYSAAPSPSPYYSTSPSYSPTYSTTPMYSAAPAYSSAPQSSPSSSPSNSSTPASSPSSSSSASPSTTPASSATSSTQPSQPSSSTASAPPPAQPAQSPSSSTTSSQTNTTSQPKTAPAQPAPAQPSSSSSSSGSSSSPVSMASYNTDLANVMSSIQGLLNSLQHLVKQ
jgi:hypothetical protein